MHQLTIGHGRAAVVVSRHADLAAARRALLRYVVAADYYLWPVAHPSAPARYELLDLGDPDEPPARRDPRIAGTATIIELPAAAP